ncbi:unnamed protein product [Dibothriocephalus latus]|uniref:UmuC domain-containing protein n=1 Tax=Dibothriocephalus latus TaxID=60516 RepID=A0A3P7LNJ1_DIBLA|nr:unnamed protein product [Dibothriocephalus latus]
MDRIILLIDMDCFYVQVEQKEQPDTVGKPCAVVQYSSTNASLIAVSYEARAIGVTRNMRDQIERASIDEAYIDATELINKANTDDSYTGVALDRCHLVVDPSLFNKLKAALKLAQTIKDAILKDTSYRCSIGVAANRMLAKIACSLNKPNKITVVPSESAQHLLNFTPIKKVPNLGGKLGDDVSKRFDLKFFGALSEIPRDILLEEYGEKTGYVLLPPCLIQMLAVYSFVSLFEYMFLAKPIT